MATQMQPGGAGKNENRDKRRPPQSTEEQNERLELLHHVQSILEPFMVVLGLVFIVLLIVDYGGFANGTRYAGPLSTTFDVIWVIFIIDFVIRYVIAPDPRPVAGFIKVGFLRSNWLTVLSLILPALRPLRALRAFRVLRAARATRSLSLVRLIGGVNRGIRLLRRLAGQHAFGYVAGMSVFVVFAGATGAWYFDRGIADAPIQNFGDALWWSSALITTMNSEKYVVSAEARVIGVLMRIFALSVFGYVTATIASYLVGKQAEEREGEESNRALAAHIESMRQELQRLREELARAREPSG